MNISGSITTGGTAQVLATAVSSLNGFVGYSVQNTSAGDLWINDENATAVLASPSIKIVSGAIYESPPNRQALGALSIIGATTGQTFTAKRF
jgi:hypothetical protein